jgi:uncharacterized membrane protein YbhN (UPF0104 family)
MNKGKAIRYIGLSLSIIAILWFGKQLLEHSIALSSFSNLDFVYLGLITLFYSVPAIVSGAAWYLLLQAVADDPISLKRAVTINCLSQGLKYVPGNAAHHVGRVVLATKHGVAASKTLFSMFLETVWTISIAGLLALIALLSVEDQIFNGVPYTPPWWVLAGLVVTTILVPVIGFRLFGQLASWWAKRNQIEYRSLHMPPLNTFFQVSLLYILNYLILGVILHLIATKVFDVHGGSIILLSGIFAVAWVIGFVTPGAPAGLGVREVILVAALTPLYGSDNAVGVTAILRTITFLGDGVVFLIGVVLNRLGTLE